MIWVDDNLGRLAPTTLGHLNGKTTARLDVILYSLPPEPGGGGKGQVGFHRTAAAAASYSGYSLAATNEDEENSPGTQTPAMISEYINRQLNQGIWTESEATGVRSLAETATRALNTPQPSPELHARLERWSAQLRSLGIEISTLAHSRAARQNEGGAQTAQASY